VRGILEERGIEAEYLRYLESTPSRDDLEGVLKMLGTEDPRDMMRTGESIYKELGLAEADRDGLLDAMVEHPIVIERPIVIHEGRAIIARPPELALRIFED
jgi:arsenate reductase